MTRGAVVWQTAARRSWHRLNYLKAQIRSRCAPRTCNWKQLREPAIPQKPSLALPRRGQTNISLSSRTWEILGDIYHQDKADTTSSLIILFPPRATATKRGRGHIPPATSLETMRNDHRAGRPYSPTQMDHQYTHCLRPSLSSTYTANPARRRGAVGNPDCEMSSKSHFNIM